MERTNCSCKKCQLACQHLPGMLTPSDLANYDQKNLVRSEGAQVVYDGDLIRIGTITPRSRPDGSCVFYNNGRCDVHEKSPAGCRYADTHADVETAVRVADRLLRQVFEDWQNEGPYSQLWHQLERSEEDVPERRRKLYLATLRLERKKRKRR